MAPKKKIVFISINNLYLCPYINKYIAAIKGHASYDIIVLTKCYRGRYILDIRDLPR